MWRAVYLLFPLLLPHPLSLLLTVPSLLVHQCFSIDHWTKWGCCGSLPRCYLITAACFPKDTVGRIDRLLLASCYTWKWLSLVISWQRINEVWRRTWLSWFLRRSFRICAALGKREKKKGFLLGKLRVKAEFSQYLSRDVKRVGLFLQVHQ